MQSTDPYHAQANTHSYCEISLRRKTEELETAMAEIVRLRAALAESEAENDQWQRKVAELWAEAKRVTAEASQN